MIEPFKTEMAARGGSVTDIVLYNPDQASYRAEVEKAFGPEPEGVFCLSLLTDFVAIAKEIYRGGFKSKVLGLGTGADADGAFIKSVPVEVSEGIHHIQPAPPLDTAWPGTVYGVDHSEVSILALYRKWHELMRG